MSKATKAAGAVVGASIAALVVAGVLWVLFPKARASIATAVILSPIPPVP